MIPPDAPPEPPARGVDAGGAERAPDVPDGAVCAVHAERTALAVCGRCGSFACAECRVEGPSDTLLCKSCEDRAAGDIPLERRAELGVVRAALLTIRAVLLSPGRFFSQRARERSLLPPLVFAIVLNTASSLLNALAQLPTLDQQRRELLASPLTADMAFVTEPWFPFLVVVMTPLTTPMVALLATTIWWAALKPLGGVRRGYRELFRAMLYLDATAVVALVTAPLQLVPNDAVIGTAGLVVMSYVAAMHTIAVWKSQETDLWRVGLALVGIATLVCGASLLLAVLMVVAMAQSMGLPIR